MPDELPSGFLDALARHGSVVRAAREAAGIEIDELLQSYLDQVRAAMSRGTPRDRRHLLGVVPLAPARPAALRAGGNLSSRHIA